MQVYEYNAPSFNKWLSLQKGFDKNNVIGGFDSVTIYSDNNGLIYLLIMHNIYGWMACYSVHNNVFVDENIVDTLHPATRKEIKAAGLWDYVINKDDYSSEQDKIETELDEYLRIGEEIEREKDIES